ncbi:hypothetical protein IF1G_00906 [Cordyceps javanica]|uniref:Uncharacterized protein n=1 Tax=Cordyceps javanica TaxID=43265 RepID=A0A545VGY3_9HYPO|nr:hypothetical protein IF1G_00906 [Cordyceps javanica]
MDMRGLPSKRLFLSISAQLRSSFGFKAMDWQEVETNCRVAVNLHRILSQTRGYLHQRISLLLLDKAQLVHLHTWTGQEVMLEFTPGL